jgi:hypothetical protein
MLSGLVKGALGALLMLAFCPDAGWAAPCVSPPLTAEQIAKFKADPTAFVSSDTDARAVEAIVRDLAGTDPSVAEDLVHMAAGAPPRFKTAIAAGLAQAAVACGSIDQQAALLIQQAVAGLPDGDFQASFAAVAGDLSTAATEAALSSANVSVGSVVIVNPNTSPGSPKQVAGGGSSTLAQITAGTVVTARTPAASSPSTTAASPVSATQ